MRTAANTVIDHCH